MQDNNIPDLLVKFSDEVKRYLRLRAEYIQLKFGERLVNLFAGMIMRVILLMLVLFMILFASFAFVFWFGQLTGNYWLGFLINGGIFIILGILLYLLRRPLFFDPVLKMYLKFSDFKEEDLEEEDE
jgi:hypothetical protein